jgi:hypothetical protein
MIFLLPVACSSSRALTPLATNPVQCACVSLQCVAGRRTCWTPTSQGPQWPASGQIMSDVCNTALIKMRACFSACALYVCCRDLDLLEFNQPPAKGLNDQLQFGALLSCLLYCIPYCASYCASYCVSTFASDPPVRLSNPLLCTCAAGTWIRWSSTSQRRLTLPPPLLHPLLHPQLRLLLRLLPCLHIRARQP